MRFRFIDAERANYPVTVLCRVLRVARSGFYAWLERDLSERAKAVQKLQAAIREVFDESRGTYGSPRVHAELVELGVEVSKSRVEREMRAMRLLARRPKKFRVTTNSAHDEPVA
jgi:transposase InsO family protein